MIIQRFNLNLIPNQSPVVVHVNQYDTGTGRLIATLYEGNEPYSPNGTAVIQGTKPDGHGFQYSATLNGNVVTADLTEQMSPVAGDVRAQIVVTESSGVTGTFVFIMRVQPSALPSDADMSESDYPLIEEAIREAQEAVIDSHDNAENSEAWAQGTRGGIPVGPTDPTYEHNAEYWAHQAEGAASGVSSFNGRSGSVLPIAGDYDSEKILLASALHIGGETQSNVQEALEALVNDGGAGHTILNGLGQEMPQRKNLRFAGANLSDDAQNDTTNVTITGGSGGSTITVTTIETTLYGETVTITDGTSTFTGVFDNSGVCVIDGVTATGTLTVSSGAASRTLNVPYFGNYTVTLSFWAATINVSTDPDVVSAIVKKDGVQIGTVNFTSGSGTYIAGSTGAYTFEVTVGGVVFSSPTVTVTEQTTYSTVIDIFNATLTISTSSSELYGKTITIKKGSTVVGTTAFSAQGSASYTVHETGTYTCECEGYSGSATVSAETTYNVTINAGLDLSAWISAGSTTDYPLNPTSYADFSALEADEEAIRQLMLVHDAVDYLATASAGDSLMQSVINSDVCAKWINISDYALDTLSANADIKSVMDTADKYGYGEWGITDSTTTPPTWGALGNVPIMTANNAPYGVASAYQVFDGNASTSASGTDFSYQSVNPICVKKFECSVNGGTLQGSNDGSTYTNISDPSSNTTYYMYHRVHFASSQTVHTLQFYGRELTPLVPTMTSNTPPRGTLTASSVNIVQPAWQAFDGDNSTYFYDQSHDAYVEYTFAEDVRAKAILTVWERNSSSSNSASMEVDIYTNGAYTKAAEYTTTAAGGGSKPITEPLALVDAVISKVKAKDIGSNNYVLVHTLQIFGSDYSEKEFATGSTRKTIYDHGVELVSMTALHDGSASATKESTQLYGNTTASGTPTFAFITSAQVNFPSGKYSLLCGKVGNKVVGPASYSTFFYGVKSTGTYTYSDSTLVAEVGVTPGALSGGALENTLDVSNITGDYYVLFCAKSNNQTREASCVELWIE